MGTFLISQRARAALIPTITRNVPIPQTGCCEIEQGPSISAETARCLACDASIVAVIEKKMAKR
jgi:hypothetical protein